MSQHDQSLADAAGATFRADNNSALAALFSNSSGATEPTTTVAYQWWADTTSGWLKQRNAANSGWLKRLPLGTGAEADLASASTCDIGNQTTDKIRITGTTTITSLGTADAGLAVKVRHSAALTLTHHASNLILPGGANITTAAGDTYEAVSLGSGAWVVRGYQRADGTAVVAPTSFVTGMGMDWWLAAAPSGWVFAWGNIGDASSSATNRANVDCEDLFTALWNDYADTEAAVSGGRGINAAADWAAHKTIAVPDVRGRTRVGKDNMGGSAASRITSAGSGITGTTLGATGGAETHTLTEAQMPAHTHTAGNPANQGNGYNLSGGNPATPPGAVATSSTGGGLAHNNTQPSIVCNYIIKL
jgi:hypothetical protein